MTLLPADAVNFEGLFQSSSKISPHPLFAHL